jgi:tRNA A-37 threonylcarbamoyl transferase component Bud32
MDDRAKYHPFSFHDKPPISHGLRKTITNLVQSFHKKFFVHGDLQDTNIIVAEGGDGLQVTLIDFNWGGLEGEARYPSAIDSVGTWRPRGCLTGH